MRIAILEDDPQQLHMMDKWCTAWATPVWATPPGRS